MLSASPPLHTQMLWNDNTHLEWLKEKWTPSFLQHTHTKLSAWHLYACIFWFWFSLYILCVALYWLRNGTYYKQQFFNTRTYTQTLNACGQISDRVNKWMNGIEWMSNEDVPWCASDQIEYMYFIESYLKFVKINQLNFIGISCTEWRRRLTHTRAHSRKIRKRNDKKEVGGAICQLVSKLNDTMPVRVFDFFSFVYSNV